MANKTNKCQAKDPSKCPHHGNPSNEGPAQHLVDQVKIHKARLETQIKRDDISKLLPSVSNKRDRGRSTNWYEGQIGDYRYQVKAFSTPSEYGIDDGKVSKLWIRGTYGDEIASYDRGWDKKPTGIEAKAITKRLNDYFNNEYVYPEVDDN